MITQPDFYAASFDSTIKDLWRRYSVQATTDLNALLWDGLKGRNAKPYVAKKKLVVNSRHTNHTESKHVKRIYLNSLLWMLTRGFNHREMFPEMRAAVVRGSKAHDNYHPSNLALRFPNGDLPEKLTNVESHSLDAAVQWNVDLECWQCVFMYNGAYHFLGFYLTDSEALKAYYSFRLWISKPAKSWTEAQKIRKARSYNEKQRIYKRCASFFNHLRTNGLNPTDNRHRQAKIDPYAVVSAAKEKAGI